jgi:hypothetical protein
MHRTIPALLAALALAACSKKDDVVVAAPVTPQQATPGARTAPPIDPNKTELPPGHPPLGGANGAMPQGDATGGGMQMPPHGAAMSAGPAGPELGDVKVAKATGKDAKTIAEVFADRKGLNGKAVTLRGKVVKYNPGIMGKNWVHLRDGTGAAGANDVTVTTQDAAAPGDVVTVHGTVAIDQDIGMGGAPYPVIIQNAKLSK